jgi:FHS family glucose/mannose:H+ symporter-like MFS transporter
MASACAGMFVFGVVMAILGAILPTLFDTIRLDKAQAGNLFLFMNFGMLTMSLLFGPIVDRFGFRLFLSASALAVAGSFFFLAGATTYPGVIAAAVLLGLGGGGLNGGTNALASDIHPDRRGAALNALGIFFGFGALTMPFLVGSFLELVGLARLLVVAGLFGLVPFMLFALSRFPEPKHRQGFPLAQAASVIRSPLLWLCSALLFFQSGNEFTVGGWITSFLEEVSGLTSRTSSFLLAAYWGAIMLGRLLSTRVVDRVGKPRLVLASAMVAWCAAILVAWRPISGAGPVGTILLGLGFAAIFPTTLAVIGEAFPRFSGTAFSVLFVIALAGGMTAPWMTGILAQSHGMARAMLVPVVNCTMIVAIQLIIIVTSRRSAD